MKIRWEVADGDGNAIGEIVGSGGEITFDSAARVKRVCRGVTFPVAEWAEVNPFQDWLRPVVTAQDGVPRPMGLFTPVDLSLLWRTTDLYEPVQPYLVDAGWYLNQESPEPLSPLPGERFSRFLARVAEEAGVTRLAVAEGGERADAAMAQSPGGLYATMMESVSSLAGFAPPWFDRNGVLQLGPVPGLDGVPAAVYGSENVIKLTRVTNQNLLDAPNVYVVRGANASGEPVEAVAEVPALFPHSVRNRGGRRVVKILSEQGLSSTLQAQRLASAAAAASVETFETVEFSSLPNTAHDGFSLVQLYDVPYREIGWTLRLNFDGVMSHRLQRVNVELFGET